MKLELTVYMGLAQCKKSERSIRNSRWNIPKSVKKKVLSLDSWHMLTDKVSRTSIYVYFIQSWQRMKKSTDLHF